MDPSSDIAPKYLKSSTGGFQFLVIYGNVSADAIGVICHQLGLLCTDLHAICYGGLLKVIYQLDQLLLTSCQARPPMSSAKRKFLIVLPPILTVPSWSSSVSAIILSKKMLKRVVRACQFFHKLVGFLVVFLQVFFDTLALFFNPCLLCFSHAGWLLYKVLHLQSYSSFVSVLSVCCTALVCYP